MVEWSGGGGGGGVGDDRAMQWTGKRPFPDLYMQDVEVQVGSRGGK